MAGASLKDLTNPNKKLAGFSLVDGISIAMGKLTSESVFSVVLPKLPTLPVIGKIESNSTIKSGLAKWSITGLAYGFVPKNQVTKPLLTGMVIDATEDMAIGLLKYFGMYKPAGMNGNNNETNVVTNSNTSATQRVLM